MKVKLFTLKNKRNVEIFYSLTYISHEIKAWSVSSIRDSLLENLHVISSSAQKDDNLENKNLPSEKYAC